MGVAGEDVGGGAKVGEVREERVREGRGWVVEGKEPEGQEGGGWVEGRKEG